MDHMLQALLSVLHAGGMDNIRADSAESAFFLRSLTKVRSQAFMIEYPELKARGFVATIPDIPSGAQEYLYRVYDKVGQAKVTSGYADGGPRVDVYGTEASQLIRGVVDAYGFNFQELRAALMAGVGLSSMKATAARWVIDKKIDDLLLEGDSVFGLTGLFNLSGTLSYTIPVGAGGDEEWILAGVQKKTALEILRDMYAIENYIVEQTKEIEVPNRMILPLSRYNLISTTPMSTDNTETILQTFLKNSKHVKRVDSSIKLETAGAGSTARAVCYNDRVDKVGAVVPQEFEQFPPQAHGFEMVTNCHARCGGVVAFYPKSICYADVI